MQDLSQIDGVLVNLNDLVRKLGAGRGILDATGADIRWPADLEHVQVGPLSEATSGDLVVTTADLSQSAAACAGLADLDPGTPVLLLVPAPLDELPVPWLLDALTAGRLQAREAMPTGDRRFPSVMTLTRCDVPQPLTPYLRSEPSFSITEGDDLITLLNVVVLEGAVWRAVEACARRRSAADADRLRQLQRELEQAAEVAAAAKHALDECRTRGEKLDWELGRTRRALREVQSSTPYRVARRLSALRAQIRPGGRQPKEPRSPQ